MVVTSKEELEARLLDGWGLSKKKGKYWYLQKRDPETGRILTEKVHDSLRDYCEQLYMMRKLEKRGVKVEQSSTPSRAEQKIEKAVETKIVQHAIKHIDKRTKKLLEWGEWVDLHITTIVPGDTWDEKAERVKEQLDEMFKTWLEYEEIASELERLRAENKILRDLIEEMKNKLEPLKLLKELIVELSRTGNTKIVENLINKYMALVVHLSEK